MNSSAQQAFQKSNRTKLKGSFITHIEGDPVFSTKDAATKLDQLFTSAPTPSLSGGRKEQQ